MSQSLLSPEGERKAREMLLADTVRLRDRFRQNDPTSLRMGILEKDVLRQRHELERLIHE